MLRYCGLRACRLALTHYRCQGLCVCNCFLALDHLVVLWGCASRARAPCHGLMSTCCHAVTWTPAEGQQGDSRRRRREQPEDKKRITRGEEEEKIKATRSADWLAAVAKLVSTRGQQEDKKRSRTGQEEENRRTRRRQEEEERKKRTSQEQEMDRKGQQEGKRRTTGRQEEDKRRKREKQEDNRKTRSGDRLAAAKLHTRRNRTISVKENHCSVHRRGQRLRLVFSNRGSQQ